MTAVLASARRRRAISFLVRLAFFSRRGRGEGAYDGDTDFLYSRHGWSGEFKCGLVVIDSRDE